MATKHFSERKLASALRIKIIDQIAEIDLPWFIFEQIDATLNELNYYKLSNLYDNVAQYTEYLYNVSRKYHRDIKEANAHSSETNKKSSAHYEQYMTNKLMHEWFVSNITKKQYLQLYTKYSVTCILTMKEYINRRILQSSRKKQHAMTKVSVQKNI